MELNASILLQGAVVLVLLAFLGPTLFDPFLALFDERKRRIEGASDEAKRLLSTAGEKTSEIEAKTRAAEADARAVLVRLRNEAAEKERAILDSAREAASARVDEARTELFEASEQARKALKGEAQQLSQQIVEKVLGRAA